VFRDITEILPIENDFTVTFVGFRAQRNGMQYKAATIKVDDATESFFTELAQILQWADRAAMLVTFDAPEGFTAYADYTYGFEFTGEAAAAAAGADK
jgi:hypothetical protein